MDDNRAIFYRIHTVNKTSKRIGSYSKWSIERMTIGMTANTNVKSIGNIGIISVGNKNDKYEIVTVLDKP